MPDPPPLRILRSRSTSTSGLPRDDGLQDQPAANVTLWKFLNVLFILFIGTAKTISAFRGRPVAPDAIDWIIGVQWALVYVPPTILTHDPSLKIDHRSSSVIESESRSTYILSLFMLLVSLRVASGVIVAPFVLFLLAIFICYCKSLPN